MAALSRLQGREGRARLQFLKEDVVNTFTTLIYKKIGRPTSPQHKSSSAAEMKEFVLGLDREREREIRSQRSIKDILT